ncbi:MAG TPA: sulfatase-like hydrolase/transferase [Pontiella sp.]
MKPGLIWILLIITAFQSVATERPNILWLTSEDNNINWVGCYGNPYAETPYIDQLATEGFQYMHCYANAPVCAPSRSTWITGIHATSLGTTPMRSRNNIPHDQIRYYPDHLRAVGYYCANTWKTDYNIGKRKDSACWDSSKTDWEVLKQNQPFFQVINFFSSHESHAFGNVDKTTHSPNDTRLAKYHPDIPEIRKNYAHYHDAVKRMDTEVGAALEMLEKSGMAENTIVIYCSDHGGVLPRSKRFLFDSGTHSPLIIRIPEKFKQLWPAEKPGTQIDRLVSFIDMPATWLKIAKIEPSKVMQGQVFLGSEADPERNYHVSYRERMDERYDNVRAIRNKSFLYIRNYMPYAPRGQHLTYMWKMEATRAWEAWHKAGKTDAVTGRWFKAKPIEELYDTNADPDNVVNLIDHPEYKEVAIELRRELRTWQITTHDSGLLPEAERVKRAADLNTTIYEMVRNREQYDLEAYLDASDLALQQDPDNLPSLLQLLDHQDSGVRYWGMIGCYLLADEASSAQPRILQALDDESHVVRAMAAYTLYQQGKTDVAKTCFKDLLKNSSYASLLVLNIIDWIGNGPDEYRDEIAACHLKDRGYVDRMKEYFGFKKATSH